MDAIFKSGYEDIVSEGVLQSSIWKKVFPQDAEIEEIRSHFGSEDLHDILSGKKRKILKKIKTNKIASNG